MEKSANGVTATAQMLNEPPGCVDVCACIRVCVNVRAFVCVYVHVLMCVYVRALMCVSAGVREHTASRWELQQSKSWRMHFPQKGVFRFHCIIHTAGTDTVLLSDQLSFQGTFPLGGEP